MAAGDSRLSGFYEDTAGCIARYFWSTSERAFVMSVNKKRVGADWTWFDDYVYVTAILCLLHSPLSYVDGLQ
ncbi:hypothetical protein AB7M46_005781 [Bradyrhizobium elkanii]